MCARSRSCDWTAMRGMRTRTVRCSGRKPACRPGWGWRGRWRARRGAPTIDVMRGGPEAPATRALRLTRLDERLADRLRRDRLGHQAGQHDDGDDVRNRLD